MPNQQPDLPRHVREAVGLEIDALLKGPPKRTQTDLAQLLDLSQGAIWKARAPHRVVGQMVADKVCKHLRTTLEALVEKHGLYAPMPEGIHPLEIAVAYHAGFIGQEAINRVRARARGRVQIPRQWGQELMEEQRRCTEEPLLTESTPEFGVPQPIAPESSRRKRG